MAEDCVICQINEGSVPSKKIYEDDQIVAFLDYNGASPGHCFIAPKQHYPIFEQVPDDIIAQLFIVANKISSALFDTLKIQGTNIFVTNGVSAGQSVAHFVVNVIPRKEGDGINLQWQPRQLSEEEMSTVEIKLKEGTEHVGVETDTVAAAPKPEQKQSMSIDEENYLWKSVNRKIA